MVEALAVLIDQIPEVIPLTDQHFLAFLSELLKMSSVADGEMSDTNLVGHVVDRNGFAVFVEEKSSSSKDAKFSSCSAHASALFLRRECILSINDANIVICEELPCGVQLRVSSISLLQAVIKGHPNQFFDAETSTPIGKIDAREPMDYSRYHFACLLGYLLYSFSFSPSKEILGPTLSACSFDPWFAAHLKL